MGASSGVSSLFTVSVVQGLVGVLLFLALLNGQRELTVLSLLVLAVTGGARLWARYSRASLHYHLVFDHRQVFPGEPVRVRLHAENAKPIPIWLEVLLPISTALQHSTGKQVLQQSAGLLWYQATDFDWELRASRRGVYSIGPLYLVTGDLFSFFSRRQRTPGVHTLVVYPRLVPLKQLPLARRDFFGVPGPASPVQDPVYILGTRDYQHGQPSKYIHWKASARHHRLQEKVFESTTQQKVLLVVDVASFTAADPADGDVQEAFEHTLEVVGSLAVRLEREGSSVGFLSDGRRHGGGTASIPIARNAHQPAAILDALARLGMDSGADLRGLLRTRLAETWGVSCVYFAYSADAGIVAVKEYFGQRNTPVKFIVCETEAASVDEETRHSMQRLDKLSLRRGMA